MSYGNIKYDKNGKPYIVMEFRRIHPKTKEKVYQSKKEYLDESLSKAKLKKKADELDFYFVQNCEEEMKLGINTDLTYRQLCDIYLKFMKETRESNTYARNVRLTPFLLKEVGDVKLKDLTPERIECLYSKIDKMTKIVNPYIPKDNFNETLKERGLTYRIMRREMGIQHSTLKKAMDGKNVGKIWAEKFAFILDIPVEKLFDIKKEEVEIAHNTKKKYISFFRASLAFAVKKRYIMNNYASAEYIGPIKNKKPNKKTKCMNNEEFLKFYDYVLNYPDLRIRSAFLILLNTGMRKEELLGLTWKNILFNDCKIVIENTVTYIQGEGTIFNKRTKNASSTRVNSVSSELIELLNEYSKSCFPNNKDDDFLFTKSDGSVIFPDTVNFWLKKLLNELELEHFTVHSLRHAYITYLIEVKKAPLISVSKRVGHSRVSTTIDMYGHIIDENDKKIANTFTESKVSAIIESLKECVNNGSMTIEAYNETIKSIKLFIE